MSWIFFLFFFFSSCLPRQTDLEPKPLPVPDAWRLPVEEGSALCHAEWWQQFGDPVLDRLIKRGLEQNQDLRAAICKMLQFYAHYQVTRSFLLPTLNGNGSYLRIQTSNALPGVFQSENGIPGTPLPGLARINNDYQGFLSLSWELDFWGRIASASQAAYADFLSQAENRRAVILSIVTGIARTYILLRQLDGQLVVSQQTLRSRLESLKLAQERFDLGETSEIEVKQAEAEVEIARIRVIDFEKAIPQAENALSILIGENPRSIERGIPLYAFQIPTPIPAGIPSDLLTRRPDILQAEQLVIATAYRIQEAKALFFPQISMTGQFGSESATLRRFLTYPAEFWQYGFLALMPLFDAGRTVARVTETEAKSDEALAFYRQTVLNAFREVNDGLVLVEKNHALVMEHQKQVKVLEEYLHLAQLRYQEGEIDYLNVLDAERSLFDAELALVQARGEEASAVVLLYGALGGGWILIE